MERARRIWRSIVVVSLLAVSILVLTPALTGRPLISYASSESMEPTIGVFDTFLVDPWPHDLAIGDIIVYSSLTKGGPAVHRIVGGNASGWITQGDANGVPDQQGGEPAVPPERILGRVVVDKEGAPLLLRHAAVPFIESGAQMSRLTQAAGGPRALVAVGLLLVAVVFGALSFAQGKRHERARPMHPRLRFLLQRTLPRGILGKHVAFGLLLILFASTAWAAAHARIDVEIDLVVVDDPGAADPVRATTSGNALAREIEVRGMGLTPTRAYIEGGSDRVEAQEDTALIPPRGSASVQVMQRAEGERGLQTDHVLVWRYPAFLPETAMRSLHALAPGLPYFVFAALASATGALWVHASGMMRMPVGRMLGVREDWR